MDRVEELLEVVLYVDVVDIVDAVDELLEVVLIVEVVVVVDPVSSHVMSYGAVSDIELFMELEKPE